MSKPTITEFLEARIAEDERQFELPDFVDEEGARGPGWGNRGGCPVCGAYQFSGTESATKDAWWEHAENAHQYWKVRAECAAKRAIIEIHKQYEVSKFNPQGHCHNCSDSGWAGCVDGASPVDFPCATIKAILPIYASHPDYQQEWAL